jgi:hypothetical protein
LFAFSHYQHLQSVECGWREKVHCRKFFFTPARLRLLDRQNCEEVVLYYNRQREETLSSKFQAPTSREAPITKRPKLYTRLYLALGA